MCANSLSCSGEVTNENRLCLQESRIAAGVPLGTIVPLTMTFVSSTTDSLSTMTLATRLCHGDRGVGEHFVGVDVSVALA